MVSNKWQWRAAWVIGATWCGAAGELHAQCETQRLVPADGAAGDQFGTSVDIDGDRIIVGSPVQNSALGAACVYQRTTSGWIQDVKFALTQVLPGDDFGRTVSISDDYAAVGAPKSDRGSIPDVGRTYMYARSEALWHAEVLAVPPWISANSEFGSAVSVSGDAVLVGTPKSDEVLTPPSNLGNSGSAYVFRRNPTTGDWKFEAWLTANDADELDQFGFTVALHDDTAFVTAFADKDSAISLSNTIGSVYVFRKQGPVWMQVQKLVPSDAAAQAAIGVRNFGRSLSTDGSVLLVGERSGQSAYVFRFDGNTWVEEAILRKPVGNTASDLFANSVAIQGDTALVGAPLDDDNALSNSGSIFVYKRSSGIWSFDSIFYGSSPAPNGRLGSSLAVGGVYAVAGAISPTTSGEATVLAVQPVPDCDGNLEQDECQLHANPAYDGNGNGHIDACECTMDSECEDNVPCTANVCDPASGICVFTPLPGFCLIAGMCQTDGTLHPDTECRQCDVSLSVTTWSAKLDGTACSDEGNPCTQDVCLRGFCSHPGEPAGLPCGDANDRVCDKPDYCDGAGQCFQNFVSLGTNCDDALYCTGANEKCNGLGICVPLMAPPCANQLLNLCDEVNDVCVQCFTNADCTGGGECPGTMCDVNGLCQLDPAQIGTACGDPATTQCSLPDTCAAAQTCAPNHLPDGTPCSPDVDPCTFDVCVNGTCAHVYEFSGDPNGAVDCNNNSIADACDLALGLSADCDGNATPDECDLPLFTAQSPQLSPIGVGFAQSFTLGAPPKATGNVTLRFAARGDFLAATEKVAISVNGMAAGEVFTFSGLDCPVTPDEEELVMTAAQFNLAAGSGDALITMTATAAVDAALCVPASWITVAVEYRGVQTGDCNGNGQFDTCEVQAGTQPDCNYNHVPDICEPDCDGDGVPDACALRPPFPDRNCNFNGKPDRCDILAGISADCNGNWIPDECEYDCQLNGIPDDCDIALGTSEDCDDDATPDECLPSVQEIPFNYGRFFVNGDLALIADYHVTSRVDVYRNQSAIWELEAGLINDQFSFGLGAGGDLVALGCGGCCTTDVCVYRRDPLTGWQQEATLAFPFVHTFFRPVFSISGNRIAIGDIRADCIPASGNPGSRCGAAVVYNFVNGVWSEEAVLRSDPLESNSRFGNAVSLDGDWLAVGHYISDAAGAYNSGRVHLFRFSNGEWSLHTMLDPPDLNSSAFFGSRVALEGKRLIVSSPGANNGDGIHYGAVYCFELDGESWIQSAKIVAPEQTQSDNFGVALEYDDPYLAIGLPLTDVGVHSYGSVHIFQRNGLLWRAIARTVAHPADSPLYPSNIGYLLGLGKEQLFIGEQTYGGIEDIAIGLNILALVPAPCICPAIPVTFIDPPNGVIDARQPSDLSPPAATPQGIDQFIVAMDDHPGTDCWRLSPSLLGIPGYPTESVDYNGDGTYTVITGGPTLPGLNQFSYTDSLGNSSIATVTSHPGNVDGGPFADANDALAHAQCCLGGSMCGPEYGHYRCDINHSEAATAEDLIRLLDLLNGAGLYSPQLGTPLPAGP